VREFKQLQERERAPEEGGRRADAGQGASPGCRPKKWQAPRRRPACVVFADNGSEFTGRLLDLWAYQNKVSLDFSRRGKPIDNSIEAWRLD
jgi:hypothetical protein